MAFKIEVSHSVAFPAKGEYTGAIMTWCEAEGIGYTFSRGNYLMKLSDAEWVAFLDFMLNSPTMVGKDEINVS